MFIRKIVEPTAFQALEYAYFTSGKPTVYVIDGNFLEIPICRPYFEPIIRSLRAVIRSSAFLPPGWSIRSRPISPTILGFTTIREWPASRQALISAGWMRRAPSRCAMTG